MPRTSAERLNAFLAPAPCSAEATLSSFGVSVPKGTGVGGAPLASNSVTARTVGLPKIQNGPAERGELPSMTAAARGSANLLAPGSDAAPAASLAKVWEDATFALPGALRDVDPATVMRPDDGGRVRVVQYGPDRFVHGRVLPPTAEVVDVDAAVLSDDGARVMHPAERRAIHDREVNIRHGTKALGQTLGARQKLHRYCTVNMPHGVLGCADTPYGNDPAGVFATAAEATAKQEGRNQRRLRAGVGRGGQISDLLGSCPRRVGVEEAPQPRQGKRTTAQPKTNPFRVAPGARFED